MKLSEHVTRQEFEYSPTAINRGISNAMDSTALQCAIDLCTNVFEPIREHLGRPIKINSGYRGPALNRAVKGALSSQHCKGQAMDLNIVDGATFDWIRENIEFDQMIKEIPTSDGGQAWIHISFRKGNNRKQVLKMEKKKGKSVYTEI